MHLEIRDPKFYEYVSWYWEEHFYQNGNSIVGLLLWGCPVMFVLVVIESVFIFPRAIFSVKVIF